MLANNATVKVLAKVSPIVLSAFNTAFIFPLHSVHLHSYNAEVVKFLPRKSGSVQINDRQQATSTGIERDAEERVENNTMNVI